MTTAEALAWWQQHSRCGGTRWAQSYLDTWDQPHRASVLGALSLIEGVTSCYEIGCASGPNLKLIRSAFPSIRLGGCEQSPVAAGMAPVPVTVGTLPGCLATAPESDVYLSMYTLAYLDPLDVVTALGWMEKLAKKAIILCEPMPLPGQPEGQHRFDLPESRHEYTRYTNWHTAWRWPIVPMKESLNTCLLLRP